MKLTHLFAAALASFAIVACAGVDESRDPSGTHDTTDATDATDATDVDVVESPDSDTLAACTYKYICDYPTDMRKYNTLAQCRAAGCADCDRGCCVGTQCTWF